jgi:hypothetical protein
LFSLLPPTAQDHPMEARHLPQLGADWQSLFE